MADTQITFRLDTVIRDEIARLIEGKKYRNQTDFIVRAIREKLDLTCLHFSIFSMGKCARGGP